MANVIGRVVTNKNGSGNGRVAMCSFAATNEANHDIRSSAFWAHKITAISTTMTAGIVVSAPVLVTGRRRYERWGVMISRRPRFDGSLLGVGLLTFGSDALVDIR